MWEEQKHEQRQLMWEEHERMDEFNFMVINSKELLTSHIFFFRLVDIGSLLKRPMSKTGFSSSGAPRGDVL